ncbi:hypothetical protein ITJ38_05705 [Agreia pratensis]|nr:hypothetical protein [Agreia pratensis]
MPRFPVPSGAGLSCRCDSGADGDHFVVEEEPSLLRHQCAARGVEALRGDAGAARAAAKRPDEIDRRSDVLGRARDAHERVTPFTVESRPEPPRLVRAGQPPHPPTLVLVENLAGLFWNELARVRFDRDDRVGEAVERCRAAVRLDGRWFTTERNLPEARASSIVVPHHERWVPLEPGAACDDAPAPDAAVSAIGFVAWGDGTSVRVTAVSVFAVKPADEPAQALTIRQDD